MSTAEFGRMLPDVRAEVPGPDSRRLAARLRKVESRNVTYLGEDFPVFWEDARGANVRDADGNVYVDLTGAFGVAFLGHGDERICRAVSRQMERLVHGMGDVHPPAIKVELLERLNRRLPWPETRTVLATSGAEAMEVALKTALLATGRPGILSFRGGYHGLTMGALAATTRSDFRTPFEGHLYPGTAMLPFPSESDSGFEAGSARGPGSGTESTPTSEEVLERADRILRRGAPNGDSIGAVVVEPIQGRGGIRIPPPEFLAELCGVARHHGALLVADEIFTGLGRTGTFLASEPEGLRPDLVCLGKALGGGFPLSACSGPASVMDAWPESEGEALHTSTFLGHPATCAAGLAFLNVLEEADVSRRAEELGRRLLKALEDELSDLAAVADIRGRGLMVGIELADEMGAEVAARALPEGVLLLPAGDRGEVVELTPPVALTDEQMVAAVGVLGRVIQGLA